MTVVHTPCRESPVDQLTYTGSLAQLMTISRPDVLLQVPPTVADHLKEVHADKAAADGLDV